MDQRNIQSLHATKTVSTVSELINVKVGPQHSTLIPSEYYCQNDHLLVCTELRCVAEPRTDDKVMCADLSVQDYSSGECSDKGGRLQCPKNKYPCNNLNSYNEFICDFTCEEHGGKRTTCYANSDGDD